MMNEPGWVSPSRAGEASSRFWSLIQSDSVRPFISLFYAPWLMWALLAAFVFPPVQIIQEQMGHGVYVAWVWISIPGTLAPIIGLQMRHGGASIEEMNSPLLFRDWMGLFLQWGGHSCMCVLLILFEVSATLAALNYSGPNNYAGVTIFAAFLLSAYMFGTALLAVQCLRKIWRGEELRTSEPLK